MRGVPVGALIASREACCTRSEVCFLDRGDLASASFARRYFCLRLSNHLRNFAISTPVSPLSLCAAGHAVRRLAVVPPRGLAAYLDQSTECGSLCQAQGGFGPLLVGVGLRVGARGQPS